ncbi:MAG: helicase-related protein [Myxococcales bacterium]|nr:helicase-related protein [Myxococcales bacterium]
MSALSIDALRPAFEASGGRVVITSPTGSGKSTRVPRWGAGPVLVVEPRRVACRALAQWVATEAGETLGEAVGYHVRDERRASSSSRILFATPGIVLRMLGPSAGRARSPHPPGVASGPRLSAPRRRALDALERFETILLDEVHERRLDTDLLMALLRDSFPGRLVAMSATLDGDRLASYLGGAHLRAEGRAHPVQIGYCPGAALLPSPEGLEGRLLEALRLALEGPGDVLVFLPGKREILEARRALEREPELRALSILELHGGLSLAEQSRVLRAGGGRRVVLATNVAETSLTVPGVGAVIDSGLVRRTRYHQGRAYLTLVPIAMDAAEQRAGRAGRVAAGRCLRLWSESARLEPRTPPEVHRESLVPLLLGAAVTGRPLETLLMFDPPKAHALADAHAELLALDAIEAGGGLRPIGEELFRLPLEPRLGRLLIEARSERDRGLAEGDDACLDAMIELVAALGIGRPLFRRAPPSTELPRDPAANPCDAIAILELMRSASPAPASADAGALAEARALAQRLRRTLGIERSGGGRPIDRGALIRVALAADPRCAHVARIRGRRVAFSNGGTELELARQSAAFGREGVEALLVLESRAFGSGERERRLRITCAMPLPLAQLARHGLGEDRLAGVSLERGRIVARIERVYAGKVLECREQIPQGAAAREAIAALHLRGSLFKGALRESRDRLEARALVARLAGGRLGQIHDLSSLSNPPPTHREWLLERLASLGLEEAADLALLSEQDLLYPELPAHLRELLDREFPRRVDVGDAIYAVEYDLERRQVLLKIVRGGRESPPPLGYLPRFEGLRVCVEAGRRIHVLRGR